MQYVNPFDATSASSCCRVTNNAPVYQRPALIRRTKSPAAELEEAHSTREAAWQVRSAVREVPVLELPQGEVWKLTADIEVQGDEAAGRGHRLHG
jgi:hypothetical protein